MMIRLFGFCFTLFVGVCSAATEMISLGGAGGPTDSVIRTVVNHLGTTTPHKMVTVSKPGAQHNIAYKYFVDCSSLCFIVTGNTLLTNQILAPTGYPRKIRSIAQPVFFLGYTPLVVLAKKQHGSFEELIKYAKSNQVYFGHSGPGTSGYEGMEYMCSFLPKCFGVQYKNGVEVMRDMAVGIIDIYVTPSVAVASVLGNPKIHPLFLIGSKIPGNTLRASTDLKLKKVDNENWLMLFHNGMANDQTVKDIQLSLRNLSANFYEMFPMIKQDVDIDKFWANELIKYR
jgi:hypothetical protein